METVKAEALLLKRGVKPTPQRVVIARYLMQTQAHPTAEEVMEAVAEALPVPLSRATVYNTLNALVQAGAIREVIVEPGRTRYDANMDEHHHFVDVRSGRVVDVPGELVPRLSGELPAGFKVFNYQVTFFGELESEAQGKHPPEKE